MSSILPELGNVPVTGNTSLDRYLMALKVRLLGVSAGQAGTVDWEDIQLNPYTTIGEIAAPTNFVVTAGNWKNYLSWTNPDAKNLSHIEIWKNTSNDVSTSVLEAVVTQPGDKYEHAIERTLLNVNLYYWIRAVSFAGMYSVWTPKPTGEGGPGGFLVNGRDTIGEVIDSVMEALLGGSPATYDPATTYAAGDVVQYTGTDGNTRRYRRLNFSIGDSGVDPTNSTHWERVSILVEGLIDGVSTVGVDGNLVVDGSLFARHIGADEINGTHIHAQSEITLSEGGKITVGNGNVVIESQGTDTGRIVVAPDGGTSEQDYAVLSNGNIETFYYDSIGGLHHQYKQLTRIEPGVANNGDTVLIPGYFKLAPTVMVSLATMQVFDNNYSGSDQTLRCVADNIVIQPGEETKGIGEPKKYQFDAHAYLDLTDGAGGRSVGENTINSGAYNSAYQSFYSPEYELQESNTRQIDVLVRGRGYKRFMWMDSYNYQWDTWEVEQFTLQLWCYYNAQWNMVDSHAFAPPGSAMTAWWSATLSSPTVGYDITHIQARLVHNGRTLPQFRSGPWLGQDKRYQEVEIVSYTSTLTDSTALANGTLNWIAIGS